MGQPSGKSGQTGDSGMISLNLIILANVGNLVILIFVICLTFYLCG